MQNKYEETVGRAWAPIELLTEKRKWYLYLCIPLQHILQGGGIHKLGRWPYLIHDVEKLEDFDVNSKLRMNGSGRIIVLGDETQFAGLKRATFAANFILNILAT